MALTVDREYKAQDPNDMLEITAGAADYLYKGAILSIGTDGYICVPGVTAAMVPIGICKKQVHALGSNAETVEIETGRVTVEKKSQHTTTILCNAGGTSNVNYADKYFTIYGGSAGTTKYCVWFNVDSAGTDPTIATPALGTAIEIAVATGDSVNTIAETIAHTLDALGGANVTWDADHSTATVTAVNANRGYNGTSVAGNAVITVTNTVYGAVNQADVGVLFYAIADDGVVRTAAKSTATIALGTCIGFETRGNLLWIDTRLKK
jgi:hypothetical protein